MAGSAGSGQACASEAAAVGPSEISAGSPLVGGNCVASATPSPPGGVTGAGVRHGDFAAAVSLAFKPPVPLFFGMDKGGRTSTVKVYLGIANQQHPASVGNSIVLGVFPCKKDD